MFTTACDRTRYSLRREALPQKYGTLHRNCFYSELKVVLLGFAIGLTRHQAIQPDTSGEDLLPAVTCSHIGAHNEIPACGCVCLWVCACVCTSVCVCACVYVCVSAGRNRESGRSVGELGASSCGAALWLQPFAASHVPCLGLKTPPVLPKLCH